jgi:hypothetical protein
MICMAADTHWSLVAWLTKSPFPYRLTAYGPVGVGVGVGKGVGVAVGVGVGLGGGIEVGVALDAGAGLGVEVGRGGRVGVGEGTSGTEVPTAAATAPEPAGAHAATRPRTRRLMRAAPHGERRAGDVTAVGSVGCVSEMVVGEPGLEPGTSGI